MKDAVIGEEKMVVVAGTAGGEGEQYTAVSGGAGGRAEARQLVQLEIGFVGVGARRAVRRSIVVKWMQYEKVAGGVGIADYVQVEIGQFGADPCVENPSRNDIRVEKLG